ncbi:GerAB/ArcD/ProY family transporter [Neobacillus bataviensis]|uniref:GerAB/ArcD/ProY family transporter n=1 Tax=Neobacillus bataviensis TaxID=220685 RepID=UPI001CBA8250|nr:GerAB/ArcD/ProY family transporter [Neobacillus bataviensis]
MKVDLHPRVGLLFNAYLLMFFIHKVQTGVGIVGLPRIVYLDSKHDAWISVFLAGVITGILIWVMFIMLKQYDSADLYGIQVDIYGRWIGNFLNIVYMIYLSACFFTIFMNYIEIVQVWIFPNLPTWQLSLVLIALSIYAVQGGVRIMIGFAFLGVLGTLWLGTILIVPMTYADTTHLFPILNVDIKHLVKGIYGSSLSMMGFELLMFFYPFIKDKKNTLLYAQIGNLYTTILFTVVTLVSIMFFAEDSLARTIWPVLSMFKIVRLPNLERFEFIAVSFWMLIILPNMSAYLWAASKGFSRVINMKQKHGIWIIGILGWALAFFIHTRIQMNTVTDYVAKMGFVLAFCYPLMLTALVLMKKRFMRRKAANAQGS